MAMKRCPVCGERFSDTYKNCPFCEEEEYWEEEQETRRPILREGSRGSSRRSPYSIVTPVLIVLILLMAALFLPALGRYGTGGEIRFENIIVCLFGGIGISLFLSALVELKRFDNGQFYVLLPVICAFTTDIGAYFFGVFLGKHRGITQVSPNKSLEGYVGGILSGCLFMLVYGLLVQNFGGLPVKLPVMALYGLLGSAITEIGDLSFSLIKRQCAVKDYGTLLPGHGGMLDRFDSTIFAAPMLLLLVEILPAF